MIDEVTESDTYDTKFTSGTFFSRIGTLTNPDGTPFNLTGYKARMQMRGMDGTAVIEWVSTGVTPNTDFTRAGTLTLGDADGTITWETPAAQTAGLLSFGEDDVSYLHEIWLYDSTNEPIPAWRGIITVQAPIVAEA